MNLPLGYSKRKYHSSRGFTAVELLVSIVVIAILGVVLFVSYNGVSDKAKSASLISDLSNASTVLKAFQIHNDKYPITISTNCNANPDSATNKCLKISGGNAYIGYSANNSSNPPTFLLIAGNGALNYKVTDRTSSTQLAQTMQPGVTPGAVIELHGAKANGGTSQGINAPLTTTWADTSGNGRNGTLTAFSGSPWSGSGSVASPYQLTFDAIDDVVLSNDSAIASAAEGKTVTLEVWFRTTRSTAAANGIIAYDNAPTDGWSLNIQTYSGYLYGGGYDGAWANSTYNGNITLVSDGNWHHAVLTQGGASGPTKFDLYLDGAIYSANYGPIPGNPDFSRLLVGYGAGVYGSGSVAVARVYPFGLSAAQVTANFNANTDW
jgi:prepilin-type N-terminal cleavage/methylation domain-containing protein